MQKHVNLVDLVKSFPTNIFLQNLASIQKRTSPIKFAHLAEKSEKGSISNLSTKPWTGLTTSRAKWSDARCAVQSETGSRSSDAWFPTAKTTSKTIPQGAIRIDRRIKSSTLISSQRSNTQKAAYQNLHNEVE